MNERDLELTGLVLVRELLRKRGTDISELERQIDKLTQLDAAAGKPSRRAMNTPRAQRPAVRITRPISS